MRGNIQKCLVHRKIWGVSVCAVSQIYHKRRKQRGSIIKIQINICTQWGDVVKIKCLATFQILVNKKFHGDVMFPGLGTGVLRGSINTGWRDFHCYDFHGSSAFTRRHRGEQERWGKYRGVGLCAVKVVSRISTHNSRWTSGALHPPERCCCCRAPEFNSAQTNHVKVTYPENPGNYFFSPPRRSSMLKTSVFLSENADKAFLRYGADRTRPCQRWQTTLCRQFKVVKWFGVWVLRP